MRFLKILVKNYGSFYGFHEFQLADRGLVLVLGQNHDEPRMNSNGSGKSTLFDALDWCLFGVVPRGDHVDSVINEEAKQDCTVTIYMVDDAGRSLKVSRFRKVDKQNGVTFAVEGIDKSALDPSETQKRIEAALGCDRDVFHATILFSQNDLWHYADATDAPRMEILTKVLQLQDIDTWLERAKGMMQAGLSETVEINQTLERKRGELTSLSGMDFQKQIDEWEGQKKVSLAAFDTKVTEVLGHAEELRKRAVSEMDLMRQLRVLEANKPSPPTALDTRELEAQVVKASSEKMTLTQQIDQQSKRILQIRTRWMGTCPECGQVVSREHVEREVSKLTSEVTIHTDRLRQLEGELQALTVRREQARKEFDGQLALYRQAIERHSVDTANVQRLMFEAQQYRRQAEQAEAMVLQLRADRERTVAMVNPFIAQRDAVQRSSDVIRAAILEAEGKQNGILERQKVLEFWVEAFGARGLKNYILDNRLSEMTDAANHWVRLLTGGTFWIRFESQTMGRTSGKLSNRTNIRVFQYAKDGTIIERNYKSWSGGQKARVSMGIDLGLSRLMAARASQRYDLLILDEVFKHLDRSGREAVVEMLYHLAQEKSSLFVVDHDAEFQAAFQNVVVMDYANKRTKVMEAKHGAATPTPESQGTLRNGGHPARTAVPA